MTLRNGIDISPFIPMSIIKETVTGYKVVVV
jgi:hypothetical protein